MAPHVRLHRWPLPRLTTLATFLVLASVTMACADADSAEKESAQPSSTEHSGTEEPPEISFGETIELASHLVEGEITVFDFSSPYCGPCRQIAPWLSRLHSERSDVSVVTVNINRPDKRGIDWGSPVARQFGLQSIPAFKVFGADGKMMAEGEAAKRLVIGWLQELDEES